ncbi:MAG: glycosyltransferase, partial [Candidatus Binataceae bacterium]
MATSLQSPIDAVRSAASARRTILVVMYANPDYHPPTVNGVRMMSARFDVRIVCRNDAGPPAEWPREVRIERVGKTITQSEIFAASALRKIWWYRGFVSRVRSAIADSAPALIYAYDPIGFAASIAALGARRSRVPVVFHCHDTPAPGTGGIRSLQDWIFRYALRHTGAAAFTVFPSKYRAPLWLDLASDPRPPMIIPNGAARDFYPLTCDWDALARRRFSFRRILYLGSMGPANGQLQALEAFANLPDQVTLDLVGFSDPAFLRGLSDRASSMGLQDRVAISGWVPDP